MKKIQKQKIEKQQLSIFLRDLASNVNTNLKYMIEDSVQKEDIEKKKKNYHKGKKKIVKKKDLIIQEQTKKRNQLNIEDDMKKMDYLFESIDFQHPFSLLNHLKTQEGINHFKLKLLEKLWENKKENMKFIIILYFKLKESNQNELLDKIDQLLDSYDYQSFMMKNAGDILPPLDYWDNQFKSFDEWQLSVINHVKKKQSVLVRAPTSSGKSFIAMSAGIFHKKILYVCPAKPVVYQVGSHFIHMGYKVHFLVDNHSHYSYDSKTNIFIGTPLEIENNLLTMNIDYDYVVFDEIHNLNKEDDGDIYENLIKLIPCNFLALSATIENIDYLKNIFEKINPNQKINYIEYNERFINHQRWIWKNNKLKKIHPLCSFQSIDDNFMNSPISYTPNDCVRLWEKIEDLFEEIDEETDILDGCSPDDYFDKKLITLNDCKEYEHFIKQKMFEFHKLYPEKIQELFHSFQETPLTESGPNIIDFIHEIKKKDMFPMLMFHTNEEVCKHIFLDIYERLDKKEEEEYPYHYSILEKKEELYQTFLKKREIYQSNLKIQSTNPGYEIKRKMEQYDRKEKDLFISNMNEFYQQKLKSIHNHECSEELQRIQHQNLTEEMNQFLLSPDFNSQDIFQKHKKFIFTKSNKPMDADTIRNVRREITKTLGIKIPYESPIFQLLKRGIGLYIENMPDEYNWILQKLLSDKEIGIVISDKTLCLGIDLPVRTSCFLGINGGDFTKDEYLQMSGRAGRRGMDTQGNIVFYGMVDYLSLMKDNLPVMKGNPKPIYETFKILKSHEPALKNMIHKDRQLIPVEGFHTDVKEKQLLWLLRNYKNSFLFFETLQTLEKKLFNQNEYDRIPYLLNELTKLIGYSIEELYKLKKINSYEEINLIKEYIQVIISIHNSLNYQSSMIIMNTCKELFTNLNNMLFSFII